MIPDYEISIDGSDVSKNFTPVLISLTVNLYDGGQTDTCEITLDDTEGQIAIPSPDAQVTVALGYEETGLTEVFVGTVHDVASSGRHTKNHATYTQKTHFASQGSRQQGRTLILTAHSANQKGKLKERQSAHKDDASFGDVAQEWGQKAGLSDVKVDAALSSKQRKYWHISNESFMQWGARMGKELGALFKVFGDTATFTSIASGNSISGQDLTTIDVTWGDNLIAWSIAPIYAKPVFSKFQAGFYDLDEAKWKTKESSQGLTGGADGADVTHTHGTKTANEDNAGDQAGSNASDADRQRGGSDHVTIDGNPDAQPQATCNVAGIRDGVDDAFTVKSVTHQLNRGSGFITELSLCRPGDGGSNSS